MRYFTATAALILSVALASTATASEIYKWTDDEGNVHYTDTPPDRPAQRMNIVSKSTDDAYVQSQTQARINRKQAAADEAASAPAGPSAEELRASKKERTEKCDMYRQRLTRFLQAHRLYREDENGERVYLDDADRQATRERTEGQIEEYCD